MDLWEPGERYRPLGPLVISTEYGNVIIISTEYGNVIIIYTEYGNIIISRVW